MKRKELSKHFFSNTLQSNIASEYDKQARDFQKKYNQTHPDAHIWRHILYKHIFYFSKNGQVLSVRVEIVRFIYAGTNKTFTFLGNLFRAFSRFTWNFLHAAVKDPLSPAALEVSAETVYRWQKLFSSIKLHNLTNGKPFYCIG